ncbi:MAG TPA: Na/Pi symporter, partial [Hyphomicrobiales bacterium]|nr:Na/Pi symporter [Hyphomicrobiales bacterium]
MLTALVPALTGLGLFFCGIWFLARNLSQVAGTSARRLFRRAFGSYWLAALTGILSGLLTQSTNAVALIVVSFVRSGVVPPERTPLAPTWAHVGASMLVFLVALDTGYVVAYLLALCGVALYFDFRLSDRLQYAVLALMGAALLLLGLDMLKESSAPLQELLLGIGVLGPDSPAVATLSIGVVLAVLTQSSTVAGAIAVALVGAGVFPLDTALLLVLGANAGSGLNYAFLARHGEATGRHILFFQAAQKLAGTLALLVPMALQESALSHWLNALPVDDAHRLAVAFLAIQLLGSGACTLAYAPLSRWLARVAPPRHEDELAKPAFLVEEALDDPALALELAERESQRLLQRLPLMLEHLRTDGDHTTLTPAVYRAAGVTVGEAVRRYLAAILDRQPGHGAILRVMRLQQSIDDTIALHEALAEFARTATLTTSAPDANATVNRMVEGLHMLLEQLVEAVLSGDE